MVIWKEENVLFNDELNAFYLRKEMFYIMTHLMHFIYGYMEGRTFLFNDALNTFYLRLYGRKEMFYLMMDSTHILLNRIKIQNHIA